MERYVVDMFDCSERSSYYEAVYDARFWAIVKYPREIGTEYDSQVYTLTVF